MARGGGESGERTGTGGSPTAGGFDFVDRVIEAASGRRVLARMRLERANPVFSGHFPGRPLVPGVLLCEALVQAGARLAAACGGDGAPAPRLALRALDRMRFRLPVGPGDEVLLEVWDARCRRPGVWRFRGRVLVAGAVAAEGDLTAVERGTAS